MSERGERGREAKERRRREREGLVKVKKGEKKKCKRETGIV